MSTHLSYRQFVFSFLSVSAVVLLPASIVLAQLDPPANPQQGANANAESVPADPEPLLRGPVHEAFAEPYQADPQPGIVIAKNPPEPIQELPPETRPVGDNVEWIPGYWGWDEGLTDFVWVSGIWRTPPPNHRWVPGYWIEVDGGYQWVAGVWVRENAEQLEYLAEAPPETLEAGPVGDPPGDNYFWIPGCWTWGGTNYLWRPGYWSIGYSNWTWIPARYYWTPYGYCYLRGYWDYPFVNRGYLFAPYYFPNRGYLAAGYRFTPGITLSVGLLTNNFWVYPRYGHYFFGDYYGNYGRFGYQPWHKYHYARRGYDPIFAHYQRYYSGPGRGGNNNFFTQINNNFDIRVNNIDRRPPQTFKEQIARYGNLNIDNRDFNIGNFARDGVAGADRDRFENAIGRSWRDLATADNRGDNLRNGDRDGFAGFTKLSETERNQFKNRVESYRNLTERRRETEGSLAGKAGAGGSGGKLPIGGKLPDGLTGDRTPGGRIVGSPGSGIQNRFRLPTPDGALRPGNSNGNAGGTAGKLPGDISSTLRNNSEAIDRARDRFRNQNGQTGQTGRPGLGNLGSGGTPSGGSSSVQSAIDRFRSERANQNSSGSGRPRVNIPGTTPGNSGTTQPGKVPSGSGSRFNLPGQTGGGRPTLDRSQLDRFRSNNSGGGSSNSGSPGSRIIPRSSNLPGGNSSSGSGAATNSGASRLQSALDRARSSVSSPGGVTSGGASGPGVSPRTRSFNPGGSSNSGSALDRFRSSTPSGGSGTPNRSFRPPSGSSSVPRSGLAPSGGSSTPRVLNRTPIQRNSSPPSDSGIRSRFRGSSSFGVPSTGGSASLRTNSSPSIRSLNPGSGASPPSIRQNFGSSRSNFGSSSPSFGSSVRSNLPSSSSFRSSIGSRSSSSARSVPNFGSGSSFSRSFGNSGGGSSSVRSFSSPSRGGSPAISRFQGGSSRSSSSARSSSGGGSRFGGGSFRGRDR